MALFSRREKNRETESAPVEDSPDERESGPWDLSERPDLGGRIDLGALRIPGRPGMQLRVELERTTRQPVAATIVIGGSTMQVQAFAAPRSAGLWDEVRPDLAASVAASGGSCDDVPGPFGRELVAHLPVTTPGGSGVRTVRFVGLDGPRWMVRATISGDAAGSKENARVMEDILRDVVVDRGHQARPPREVLPLVLPGAKPADAESAENDPLAILRRGPEMTETR